MKEGSVWIMAQPVLNRVHILGPDRHLQDEQMEWIQQV